MDSTRDCLYIRRDMIAPHLVVRYRQRGVDRVIDLDTLIAMIEDSWRRRCFYPDRDDVEGYRYRVEMPCRAPSVRELRIVVIVEKTPKCLLPVTLWSKKLP